MRVVLQRVSRANVTVGAETTGAIDRGLVVLAAVHVGDGSEDAEWMAGKIVGLRIFADDHGRMNRSVVETGGSVLLVPQFTLYGDARKGRRPSFVESAAPDAAVPLLQELRRAIETAGVPVEEGRFGAHMVVDLRNDGPVTLVLDSQERRNFRTKRPGSSREAPSDVEPNDALRARLRLLGAGSPLAGVRLVLASASERRRRLLSDLGLTFTVDAADVDEQSELPEDPELRAATLAERKARAVGRRRPEAVVIAADTIVVTNGRILGKPGHDEEAVEMLRQLGGRDHRVITGVCVAHTGRDVFRTRTVTTTVTFRNIGTDEITRYVNSREPFGKAGAYAIQGLGGLLVTGIRGDYTNVVGLPLGATLDLLDDLLPATPSAPGGS